MQEHLSDKRTLAVVLFNAFQKALGDLCAKDGILFAKSKNKAAISHKLAQYLEKHLEHRNLYQEGLTFDIMLGHADIVLHDRKEKVVMTIMLFHDYIPSKEISLLKKKMAQGALLTLAVAFLPGKDYLLIYRVGKERIEYYHFCRQGDLFGLCISQKRMEQQENNGQLVLPVTPKRKKKARKEKQSG